MNINTIKNTLTLWKSIDNFYGFNRLATMSNDYYNHTIVIVIYTRNDAFFQVKFTYIPEINGTDTFEVSVNSLFFTDKNLLDLPPQWKGKFLFNNTNNFIDEVKDFLDLTGTYFEDTYGKVTKWCFLPDLYSYILSSLNT